MTVARESTADDLTVAEESIYAAYGGMDIGLDADDAETQADDDAHLPSAPVGGMPVFSGSTSQQQLFCLLYRELHHLARRQIARRGGSPMTLGVTTLLHEAYLKISAQTDLSFPTQGHFIAYAARAMRGLIVDHARRCASQKRGGEFDLITLDTETADTLTAPTDIVRIDEHLGELQTIAPDLAQLIDLKFFCGLSFREIAQMRGCSERTVYREWDKARALLGAMLRGDVGAAPG